MKHLLRYLRLIIIYYIRFSPYRKLIIYSDIDYITNKTNRKSILAFIGIISGGLVFWGSRKQTIVVTATIEAEYISISSIAKQGQ